MLIYIYIYEHDEHNPLDESCSHEHSYEHDSYKRDNHAEKQLCSHEHGYEHDPKKIVLMIVLIHKFTQFYIGMFYNTIVTPTGSISRF